MELGEIIIEKYIVKEHECEECGEPAQYKHTYLLRSARNNPRSNAFGRDDCTWCEDECRYACKEHSEQIRHDPPHDMSWCSTFARDRGFEHMFLYKSKLPDNH